MNISQSKNATFEKLYHKYVSNKDNEIEARFGVFDKNKHFTPGIAQDQFARIHSFLVSKPEHYEYVYSEDIVKVYEDGIREISINGEDSCMKKENLGNFDINDYNIRISFAKEITGKKQKSSVIVYEKSRARHSFICRSANLKFDMDHYHESNTFSIELESLGCEFNVFYSNIVFLLKIIQESSAIVSSSESKKVLMEYYKSAHKKKFIGIQPETISIKKIQKNIDYAITKKLDGKRFLLVPFEKNLYMISGRMEIKKLPYVTNSDEKFIMDGEYFNGSFYIFDLCNSELNLANRIEEITRIMSSFSPVSETPCKILIKKYYYGDLYNNFSAMTADLNDKIYDGLIIVKTKTDYIHSSPLKWKPLNKLTIDFQIARKDNGEVSFLVYDEDGLVEFTSNNVDDEIMVYYADNSIVECYWNPEKEIFTPVKYRSDKTKPNFIKVAQDNWNSIQKPFDIKKLKDFQSRKQSSFYNMRRYHNWVKRILIDKYSKDTVLDLACGKGGDFSKYIDSGIKYIEAYDIHDDSLKEANNRKNYYLNKAETKNVSFKIDKKDLRVDIVNSKYKFDMIVCNFAFHYFYKSLDVFVTNILSNARKGSHVILTFFDGDKVKEGTTDTYSIKKINEDKITVYLKDSVLHDPVPEYLVDIPTVIGKFAEYNINLVENINFSDMYNTWNMHKNTLSQDEKDLSFMNNACVFKFE